MKKKEVYNTWEFLWHKVVEHSYTHYYRRSVLIFPWPQCIYTAIGHLTIPRATCFTSFLIFLYKTSLRYLM